MVFQIGQRVKAIVWGEEKYGTVTRVGKSGKVVWVHWDGEANPTWVHTESLALLD